VGNDGPFLEDMVQSLRK